MLGYINLGSSPKTYYGFTYQPGEIHYEAPGYINDPEFLYCGTDEEPRDFSSSPIFESPTSKLYIHTYDDVTVTFCFTTYGDGLTIDYGDGTVETVTGAGAWFKEHTYVESEYYTVTFTPQGRWAPGAVLNGDSGEIHRSIVNTDDIDSPLVLGLEILSFDGNGISTLPQNAFFDLDTLESVTFSAVLTTIGAQAFGYCAGLVSVGTLINVSTIEPYAFVECRSLVSVDLRSGVSKINEQTFAHCESLTDINLLPGLVTIESEAFSNCASLHKVELPVGLTTIGNDAFSGCSSLVEIVIPDSVTQIGMNTFVDCTSLEKVSIGDGLSILGLAVFRNCTSLQDVQLSEGLTHIGLNIFQECGSLETITVPDSVVSIGEYAFAECSALKSVHIGSGVTSIATKAFNSCTSLQSFTILAATPPTLGSDTFDQVPIDCVIYVPAGSVSAYKEAPIWSIRADYIVAIPE